MKHIAKGNAHHVFHLDRKDNRLYLAYSRVWQFESVWDQSDTKEGYAFNFPTL